MAIGALNANGIWIYGEDDPASPASDLLNLGQESTSDAVGDAKARLTTLEAPPAAWTAAALGSSWVNAGEPYRPVGYRKVGGMCELRGLMAGGAIGEAFTLPPGFRSGAQESFLTYNGGGGTNITVTTGGAVYIPGYIAGGSNAAVSLSGIRFSCVD